MGLSAYNGKRDFTRTAEPPGKVSKKTKRGFAIQKHAASRLHYDFRLEHRGVLLSWAVPKGPSIDPTDKRLAVRVEDHPVAYGGFEGVIPKGEYGAGAVLLWDRGSWKPEGDVDEGLRIGKLEFELRGEKLHGAWKLVCMRDRRGGEDKNWLLMKRKDEVAVRGGRAITEMRPESVTSGKIIESIGVMEPGGGSKPPRRSRRRSLSSMAKRLTGARPAKLSGFLPVQLATLVDAAPESSEWVHEVKYDGYRMIVEIDGSRVRWFSRNGRDWTKRFAHLSPVFAELPVRSALVDGEVVLLDERGVSHFQALQHALGQTAPEGLTYFAFDVMHLDGYDLRDCTLLERKRLLEALLAERPPNGALRFSEHVEGNGPSFLRAACENELEGIISKRATGRYVAGRSRDWTKGKCGMRQEFVIIGFTKPRGSRVAFGALVLGVREKSALRFAGRVGTGFDRALLKELHGKLLPLRVEELKLSEPVSAENRRGVLWVKPKLVAEVGFSGWTEEGLLRHPTFVGLREDKSARSVVRERPSPRSTSATESDPMVAGVLITHADRVLDAKSGVTKLDVAHYYAAASPLLLPHIADRPLSVVRCPKGFAGTCFFQKHGGEMFADTVKSIRIKGSAEHLMVDSLEGLIALVQMNVIELHPWGSRADLLEKPDRLFFDLDPAPDVSWPRVVDAAFQMRDVLSGLNMDSFVKTTGGRGLHVVVALARRYSWDQVKEFSRAVAVEMARVEPKQYVAVATKAARKGRIFIDYLRNARGATAVAPYSLRARPTAPLSVPLAWADLATISSGAAFHLEHGVEWSRAKGPDAWAGFEKSAQTLTR